MMHIPIFHILDFHHLSQYKRSSVWHCTIKGIIHVWKHFLLINSVRRIVTLVSKSLQKWSNYFSSIVNQWKVFPHIYDTFYSAIYYTYLNIDLKWVKLRSRFLFALWCVSCCIMCKIQSNSELCWVVIWEPDFQYPQFVHKSSYPC